MSAEVITSQMNDVNDHNRFDQTELTSEFLSKISEQRVNAIFRLVPVMMLYNIIGTIAVVISANKQVFPPYLAIWSVLSIVAAVLCIWVWWKWSTSSIQIEKPKNFVRKIIAASVIFGSLWGVLPAIIFADGNAEQMHLVGMTTVGAVAAAGIMLSAIPLAIVGFIAPLALSFAIYLFLGSLPIGATVASLLMISVVFSLLTSLAYTKTLESDSKVIQA